MPQPALVSRTSRLNPVRGQLSVVLDPPDTVIGNLRLAVFLEVISGEDTGSCRQQNEKASVDFGKAVQVLDTPVRPAGMPAQPDAPSFASSSERATEARKEFQVVIDKVLVHRTLSTLDVLVIGLIGIGVFEAILGGLRTYLFAHSTNRIDVELGARLFRHLMALPIAYFEARRTGDSVARVRELENIRQFLTGSALTLVIDLFFCFVFLAVMFYYAPLLTWIVLGAERIWILVSRPKAREMARPSFCQLSWRGVTSSSVSWIGWHIWGSRWQWPAKGGVGPPSSPPTLCLGATRGSGVMR